MLRHKASFLALLQEILPPYVVDTTHDVTQELFGTLDRFVGPRSFEDSPLTQLQLQIQK